MFFARLKEDIDAVLARDPAARSRLEVALVYPGVHAMIAYRLSHWLWGKNFRFLGRLVSHLAKVFTGVEIHPGATIGRRVFIDHATGVVIGETAEVGDDVTLYQGVTLGGTSLEKGKRHPTLHDGVIVGAGAQILGPITVGAGARVGANAVVVSDVAPGSTMVGIPAKAVLRKDCDPNDEFCAYGVPRDSLPDPVARAMDTLRDEVLALSARVRELEASPASAEPSVARPKVVAGAAVAEPQDGVCQDDRADDPVPLAAAGGGKA